MILIGIIFFLVAIFIGGGAISYKLSKAIPSQIKDKYQFVTILKGMCISPNNVSHIVEQEHMHYFQNSNRLFLILVCYTLFIFLLFVLYEFYWLYEELLVLCK